MSSGGIFCCREQDACDNYRTNSSICFRQVNLISGEGFENDSPNGICLLFIISGGISVISKENRIKDINAGEMIVLSALDCYRVLCCDRAELVVFTSDHPKEYSGGLLKSLKKQCEEISYYFDKLPIRRPLDSFLNLLLNYLKDGMNCGYLQEEKQEELFILLSNYYTRDELGLFLYPYMMQKDTDFRKIVLVNSLKAKSVQELIFLCGYTASGFKKIFKEMFDEPIYQWMLQQKAEKLRYCLAEDDVNLKGLIDEFGFSSPAHFTKFCKKWLEKTPTQFIEDVKNQREQINL